MAGRTTVSPSDNRGGSRLVSEFTTTFLSNQATQPFGFGFSKTQADGYLKCNLDSIPPKSRVLSARLLYRAASTSAPVDPGHVYVAALRPDGYWDADFAFDVANDTPRRLTTVGSLVRSRVVLRTSAPATLLDASVTAAQATQGKGLSKATPDNVPYIVARGQIVQASGSGTLATGVVKVLKTGTPTHAAFMRVYSVGADFQPQTLLAQSDSVLTSTFNGPAQDRTFTFTGANQISIVSGTYYAVIVSGGNVFSPTNYFNMYGTSDTLDTDDNERELIVAPRGGFGSGSYPYSTLIPELYEDLTLTPIDSPNGSIVRLSVPPTIINVNGTLEGLGPIVNEWVQSKQFIDTKRLIALIFDIGDSTGFGLNTFVGTTVLQVDYIPHRVMTS